MSEEPFRENVDRICYFEEKRKLPPHSRQDQLDCLEHMDQNDLLWMVIEDLARERDEWKEAFRIEREKHDDSNQLPENVCKLRHPVSGDVYYVNLESGQRLALVPVKRIGDLESAARRNIEEAVENERCTAIAGILLAIATAVNILWTLEYVGIL